LSQMLPRSRSSRPASPRRSSARLDVLPDTTRSAGCQHRVAEAAPPRRRARRRSRAIWPGSSRALRLRETPALRSARGAGRRAWRTSARRAGLLLTRTLFRQVEPFEGIPVAFHRHVEARAAVSRACAETPPSRYRASMRPRSAWAFSSTALASRTSAARAAGPRREPLLSSLPVRPGRRGRPAPRRSGRASVPLGAHLGLKLRQAGLGARSDARKRSTSASSSLLSSVPRVAGVEALAFVRRTCDHATGNLETHRDLGGLDRPRGDENPSGARSTSAESGPEASNPATTITMAIRMRFVLMAPLMFCSSSGTNGSGAVGGG